MRKHLSTQHAYLYSVQETLTFALSVVEAARFAALQNTRRATAGQGQRSTIGQQVSVDPLSIA